MISVMLPDELGRVPAQCQPPKLSDPRHSLVALDIDGTQSDRIFALCLRNVAAGCVICITQDMASPEVAEHRKFVCSSDSYRFPARGPYRRMARWGISALSRASAGGTCSLTEAQRRSLACALALAAERVWLDGNELVARLGRPIHSRAIWHPVRAGLDTASPA